MPRNQWPDKIGMGGRIVLESVAGLPRNMQWDTQGACLFMKRLETGRFVWPAAKDGKVCVTSAQLAMLLEGVQEYPVWRD